jgi:hypothetical protein
MSKITALTFIPTPIKCQIAAGNQPSFFNEICLKKRAAAATLERHMPPGANYKANFPLTTRLFIHKEINRESLSGCLFCGNIAPNSHH